MPEPVQSKRGEQCLARLRFFIMQTGCVDYGAVPNARLFVVLETYMSVLWRISFTCDLLPFKLPFRGHVLDCGWI